MKHSQKMDKPKPMPGQNTKQLQYLLKKVLLPMWQHPQAQPFRMPVSAEKPGLKDTVALPVNLCIIRDRLETNQYLLARDCVEDFRRMFFYHYLQSKSDTDSTQVHELEKLFLSKLAKIPIEETEVTDCSDDSADEENINVKGAQCGIAMLMFTIISSSFVGFMLWSVYLGVGQTGAVSKGDAKFQVPFLESNVCEDKCTVSIVESIPQNLTYQDKRAFIHQSTYSGLKTLLSLAKESIHIASFYWTLKGDDIAYHDDTAKEGEDIFDSLMKIGKENKVSIKIAQNAENNDTLELAKSANARVRTLNFTSLMGNGILHTKFWVVDGRHFYIGSANLDWRSLTQVKELGVLVQDCPCLGRDVEKLFEVYWYLGTPGAKIPQSWPTNFSTAINITNPITVAFNQTRAPVFMSSSPPPFCPAGRTGDIDAILHVIDSSKDFVYIAVMDYSPSTLYEKPNKYWPVIDDALRNAAFDRGLKVRLLASKWSHTMKDMFAFLCSLSMLQHTHYPKMHVEVKLFEVPVYTKNQSQIPFARVNHNKYMVTDQHAYIGTSNWSGDYFINTGGVGFVLQQPKHSLNSTQGNLRQQLEDVFLRDWYSSFSHPLNCTYNSTPHHHVQSEL